MAGRIDATPAAPPPLDDVDRRLLRLLVEDGRLSMNELAGRAHVSRATAYARVERLRSAGLITGFSANLDPAKVGLPVTALILAHVEQHEWREVLDDLERVPGVEYVALTSGAFDLALLVRVPDIGSLRDVVLVQLHGMRRIRSTQTIFVLDERRYPTSVPQER